VNKNNAKAEDVLKLIELIKHQVHEKTGLELESEVRYINYEGNSG
jgi:UDP-N-acetylenolpyruvoylglucosamine reductase